MRVIAGKYKGKKLIEFNLDSTRPTLTRVRESVCDILQFYFNDAKVLDLFSGSGAFAIEALSRGAASVDVVDHDKNAINIIKQNLAIIASKTQPYHMDYHEFLELATKEGYRYDIVYLDPPYLGSLAQSAVNYILNNNLLKVGGIIMIENSYVSTPISCPQGYIYKGRNYGTPRLEWIIKE